MMLNELHQRGYQQLRILPGMSPNGCCWRWMIYPKALMNGEACLERHNDYMPFDCPLGTTGLPKSGCNIVELADHFIDLYPNIVLLAKGEDAEYMEWFKELVRNAESLCFPIAFADGPVGEEWGWTGNKENLSYPPLTTENSI